MPRNQAMKILNAESHSYSPKALEILQRLGKVIQVDVERDELLELISDADVLIVRLRNRIDEEILDRAKHLQVIMSATTGTNHIDIDKANDRGISVLSLKGEQEFLRSVTATAELTWGLLLNLMRRLPEAMDHVATGQWNRDLFKGAELRDKTIGIIGLGRLGTQVAQYAHAFGMKILSYDPFPMSQPSFASAVSLNKLLESSDIISIHVPLNVNTTGFLGKAEIEKMKDGVILLNTSRGEVLNEDAVAEAFASGKLAGLGLDVLANETTLGINWLKQSKLATLARLNKNIMITPHIGGCTSDSMEKTEIFMANKLKRFLS